MNNTEKLMLEYRKLFYKTYHNKMVPMLLGFEEKRKKYLQQMYFWAFTTITIITIICLSLTFNKETTPILLSTLILGIFSLIQIIFHHNTIFIKEFKSYCLKPFIQIFGNISWEKGLIPDQILQESELFSIFNIRNNDDGFYGKYNEVDFEISEIELKNKTGSGKKQHIVRIFKGVIIKFASNKSIRAKTIIVSKGDNKIKNSLITSIIPTSMSFLYIPVLCCKNTDFFTIPQIFIALIFPLILITYLIINKINKNNNKFKLKRIHLEDPKFEKKFNTYSTDEIESRYLITTGFMERFLNLKTAFKAKQVKCAFFDNYIIFAISTNHNLFEIGSLFKKLDNGEQISKFFNEFASIMLLVEHFKLNKKLGL